MFPILRREISPHFVSFPAEDFDLIFRPSDMITLTRDHYKNFAVGVESDPSFEFIERAERMTPKIRTSFIRVNQNIGIEAEEVLGALYKRFPPTIILPRTHFAQEIYRGKVPLFDHCLDNYPKSN